MVTASYYFKLFQLSLFLPVKWELKDLSLWIGVKASWDNMQSTCHIKRGFGDVHTRMNNKHYAKKNSIDILKYDGRELVTGSGKGCHIKKYIYFIEESVISVQLD